MTTNDSHIPDVEIDMDHMIDLYQERGLLEKAILSWVEKWEIEWIRAGIRKTAGKIVNSHYGPGFMFPLEFACTRNNLSIVKILVENGADVETQCNNGRTPLLIACMNKNIEIARYLLEKWANPNAKDTLLWTPVRLAFHNTDRDMLKLLDEHGAEWDFKDWESAEKEGRKIK